MKFLVITSVASPNSGGNMATNLEVYRVAGRTELHEDILERLPIHLGLELRSPVFHVGEVVIVDDFTGREIPYPQRKPSKWDVDYEEFDDLGEALGRARQVVEGAR